MKFKITNQLLVENLIFNRDNIELNVDKFYNNEINTLLITGFSGSGKSTLANQFEKKGCICFEIDELEFYLTGALSKEELSEYTGEEALKEFIQKNNLESGCVEVEDHTTVGKWLIRYIDFLVSWCKNHSGKFVINGLQIYELGDELNSQTLTDVAIIIVGTSALISSIRAAQRNSEFSGSSILQLFPGLLRRSIKDNGSLERFVNQLKK